MIWNPQLSCLATSSPVIDLLDELILLCGETLGGETHKLEEVAQAVAASLECEPGEPLPDPKVVVTLASKALWSIGEARAARRLGLLGSGMFRQVNWNVAGDAPMWVLDVQPLAVDPETMLEMQLVARLDLILDCMADVWDDCAGNGILGLLHLGAFRPAARRCMGRGAGWAAEVKAACGTRLEVIGQRRGWARPPAVIALELQRQEPGRRAN